MSRLRDLFNDGIRLAGEKRAGDALPTFEKGLEEAVVAGDSTWTERFARNAAMACEQLGNLEAAEQHYRVAIRAAPTDGYLLLALAQLYQRRGQHADASSNLEKAVGLATQAGDQDLLQLLEKAQER